jgi:hypothetical protein
LIHTLLAYWRSLLVKGRETRQYGDAQEVPGYPQVVCSHLLCLLLHLVIRCFVLMHTA